MAFVAAVIEVAHVVVPGTQIEPRIEITAFGEVFQPCTARMGSPRFLFVLRAVRTAVHPPPAGGYTLAHCNLLFPPGA